MGKPLVLGLNSLEEKRIVISGTAHIGRGKVTDKDRVWESVPKPELLGDVEKVIVINQQNWGEAGVGVSRNHACIVPDGDGYIVHDLGSTNGTFLNGKKLQAPRRLAYGDKISIGSGVNFRIYGYEGALNHALLVGHDGGNLQGVSRDLNFLSREFAKKGFRGNIKQMFTDDVRKVDILDYLQGLAYVTVPESHFIFHYSGHGNGLGMQIGSQTVSPDELFEPLWNVQGGKALILDNCKSGVFVSEENRSKRPPRSIVLASTSEDGPAYEGTDFRIAGGGKMGIYSLALARYLSREGRLSLKQFAQELKETFKGYPNFVIIDERHHKEQKPSYAGTESFTIVDGEMPTDMTIRYKSSVLGEDPGRSGIFYVPDLHLRKG